MSRPSEDPFFRDDESLLHDTPEGCLFDSDPERRRRRRPGYFNKFDYDGPACSTTMEDKIEQKKVNSKPARTYDNRLRARLVIRIRMLELLEKERKTAAEELMVLTEKSDALFVEIHDIRQEIVGRGT